MYRLVRGYQHRSGYLGEEKKYPKEN
jgi:hypothetical protein